jgi:hypothetical protein
MKRHLGVKINGPCYPHWFKRYKKSTYAGGKMFVVALLTMLVTFMTITTFQGKFGLSIKIFNELKWVRYPKHLIHSYSVVNRHQVDADPNLDLISMLMPIQVRIRIQTGIKTTHADPTPKFYTCLKIRIFFLFLFVCSYNIQPCFICRPSDSTVPTDAGIEPRTVATGALAVRRSNH